MNSNPEISIIVPIYNVERYLDRCIKSILNQTFKDFELILVNDGSTDKSGVICDNYKNIDDRIVVIHKENEGLSSARNSGLDIAKGKYIGFVDSDDYIDKDMYHELYEALIKNNSDISICKFVRVYDDSEIKFSNNDLLENNYSNIEALKELYKENSLDFIVVWNKLYKSGLIKNNRYPIGRKYEDEFIIHKLLYKCNKVTYINKELYCYYQRKNSIINSKFSIKDIDRLDYHLDRVRFFNNINEKVLKEKSIYNFVISYFDLYSKVKYTLKDEYNRKKLKKIIIKNYHYICTSDSFSVKEKLVILIFILNEKYYYSRIEKGTK